MLANRIVSMIITSCRQPHYRLVCMSTVSFHCLTLVSGQMLSIVQLYFQTMQTGRNGTLTNFYLPSSSGLKMANRHLSHTLYCYLSENKEPGL